MDEIQSPETTVPAIAAYAISKKFGNLAVVSDFELSVMPGSVHSVIGAPGSGKTILIRMLATLEPADSGRILICGNPTEPDVDIARAHIGYMPQLFWAYDGMSVTGYLDFYALAYGVERQERVALREALLELLDLIDLKDEPANNLSADQRQRLSLARCLIHDPDVLLLDEPFSNLSDDGQTKLATTLGDLAGLGKALLFTGRTDSVTLDVCDRVISLPHGHDVVTATGESVDLL